MLTAQNRWVRPLFDGSFEHQLHATTPISSSQVLVYGGLSGTHGFLDDFFLVNTGRLEGLGSGEKEERLTQREIYFLKTIFVNISHMFCQEKNMNLVIYR
jgi:hypothetical protein